MHAIHFSLKDSTKHKIKQVSYLSSFASGMGAGYVAQQRSLFQSNDFFEKVTIHSLSIFALYNLWRSFQTRSKKSWLYTFKMQPRSVRHITSLTLLGMGFLSFCSLLVKLTLVSNSACRKNQRLQLVSILALQLLLSRPVLHTLNQSMKSLILFPSSR